MPRQVRIAKKPSRILRDLEEHLTITEDALVRLLGGEAAYLKPLCAELRVLMCMSSGTEGLLWRIADSLGASDRVEVDRSWIKTGMAGNSARTPYTHETLIRAAAQQTGSAHEDDSVEADLVELEQTQVGHVSALTHIMITCARTALSIGNALLGVAEAENGYPRTWHPAVAEMRYPGPLPCAQASNATAGYDQDAYVPPNEGTISFGLRHPNPAWQTDGNGYEFGCCGDRNLWVSSAKLPDGTLAFCIAGVREEPLMVTTLVPEPGGSGVRVAVSWSERETTVYINGKPAVVVTVTAP